MVKIIQVTLEAVRLWTGWGTEIMPKRDDARILKRFGDEFGQELLRSIKMLENDFYSSQAYLIAADMRELEKKASEDFKRMHPKVDSEVVKALAWCCTFDFK